MSGRSGEQIWVQTEGFTAPQAHLLCLRDGHSTSVVVERLLAYCPGDLNGLVRRFACLVEGILDFAASSCCGLCWTFLEVQPRAANRNTRDQVSVLAPFEHEAVSTGR